MRQARHFLRFTAIALLAVATWCAAPARAEEPKAPKYVILLIGDGMGTVQVHAAEAFLAALKRDDEVPGTPKAIRLAMRRMAAHGLCTTHADDRLITDSAAAGTALACGRKTRGGIIAMGPDRKTPYRTLAEGAKALGWGVGIVSSVSIDHATPACFYAHAPSRNLYHDICLQLARSGFDFFGGGGMKGRTRKQVDAQETALEQGFVFTDMRSGLEAVPQGKRVLTWNRALAGAAALYFEIDRLWLKENGENEAEKNQMSLADFTRVAIDRLSKNPKGFFLMVEGGKIDWACHANDAATAVRDVLAFDEAVSAALAFEKKHPGETLVVVTADHECGGMSLGSALSGSGSALERLARQKVSSEVFLRRVLLGYVRNLAKTRPEARRNWDDGTDNIDSAMKELLKSYFGLDWTETNRKAPGYLTSHQKERLEGAYDRTMSRAGRRRIKHSEERFLLYGGYDPLTVTCTRILGQKAGVSFTSFSHTAAPVPVMAHGRGAEGFAGYYENTGVPRRIARLMGVDLGD